MADKYRDYLAINVLNEGRVVNYRDLSRAIKVHNTLAKQLLYEFHRQQTAKKPNSLHATYLVTGTRVVKEPAPDANGGAHDGDGADTVMQSSPFMSSMSEQETIESNVKITTITLVQEEDLDKLKNEYEEITSIHVYSLEPTSLKNLQILSDCNRRVTAESINEDPLNDLKPYGVIQNPHVKRRKVGKVSPLPAATTLPAQTGGISMARTKSTESKASTTATKEKVSPTSSRPSSRKGPGNEPAPTKPSSAKTASLRRENSDIFKSFAKAKKVSKGEGAGSLANVSSTLGTQESAVSDEPMKDSSDGEHEDGDDIGLINPSSGDQATRNLRAERDANLRKMMEDDDEEMQDAAPTPIDEAEAGSPIDKAPEAPAEEDKPQVIATTISGGRRRGRRRVMKKKTTRDEEGYLVTNEEPVWESFSEDEPAPKVTKAPVFPSHSAAAGKAKKGAAQHGQGKIMNFFSKK